MRKKRPMIMTVGLQQSVPEPTRMLDYDLDPTRVSDAPRLPPVVSTRKAADIPQFDEVPEPTRLLDYDGNTSFYDDETD